MTMHTGGMTSRRITMYCAVVQYCTEYLSTTLILNTKGIAVSSDAWKCSIGKCHNNVIQINNIVQYTTYSTWQFPKETSQFTSSTRLNTRE
jgi:hypothetical protein